MITFEITEKPTRTLMTVEDVEVVVGTKYDIALQSEVKLINEHLYPGEPFDSFKYKINNDAVASVNEGVVTVNFETDKTVVPEVVTLEKNILLFGSFFFSGEVAPSQYYDRITITAIMGKGNWFYNGNPVAVGQTLFYYQLVNNLQFVADDLGVENNYAEINWTSGTILGNHPGTNSLVINSTSEGAELLLLGSNGSVIDSLGVETYTYFVSIERGKTSAPYSLNVDTTNFPDIGGTEKVEMFERDSLVSTIIDTLGVVPFDSELDATGGTTFVIYINKFDVTTIENSVELTLTQVDGASDTINPLHNHITLLIPITPTP